MPSTILEKLVKSIQSASKKKIPTSKCMHYLLGNSLSFNDKHVTDLLKQTTSLSVESLSKLANSKWKDRSALSLHTLSENINEQQLHDTILKIYNEYFTKPSHAIEINYMIHSLVFLYFFGTTDVEYLFKFYCKKPCNNYVPLKNHISTPDELFGNGNIVFISGAPGTGKTEFVKYFLETNKTIYKDIGWLESSYNPPELSDLIKQIPFFKFKNNFDVKSVLSRKPSNSILIIDAPAITNSDWDFINNFLSKLKLRIIITTHSSVPKEHKTIYFNDFSKEFLVAIFQKNCDNEDFTDLEFERLFNIISFNPYVVTLVAKTLSAKNCKVKKETLLNDRTWLWNEKNLPPIHSSYKDNGNKSGLYITKLIERILDFYPSDFLKDQASQLAIWAKSEISYSRLLLYFTEDDLQTALDMGLLNYTNLECTTLQMPSLIADAIWNYMPLNYSEYEPIIYNFFNLIQYPFKEETYANLYQYILNIIYRFHYQVTVLPSRTDEAQRLTYDSWNFLLLNFSYFLILSGNADLAQDTLSKLFICKGKKPASSFSTTSYQDFEKKLLKIQNHMMKGSDIVSDLDSLIHELNLFIKDKELCSIQTMTIKRALIFLSKNMIDFTLRMEKNYTFDLLTNESTQSNFDNYYRSLSRIYEALDTLQKFISNFPKQLFKHEYYYYKIIELCLLSIYKDSDYFSQIDKHLQNLQDATPPNPELYFQALLQKYYYSLILYMMDIHSGKITHSKDAMDSFINEFRNLCERFESKFWLWDTTWLFYQCVSILLIYILADERIYDQEIIDILLKYYSRINKFATEQLTLTNEELTIIINLINNFLTML